MAPGTTADGRTFQEVLLDLTLPHASDDGILTNKYDLLCPRGCRSIILKRGAGQLVERSGIQVRPMAHLATSCGERQLRLRWIPLITPSIPLWIRFQHRPQRCSGGSSHRPRWHSRMSGFLDPWRVQEMAQVLLFLPRQRFAPYLNTLVVSPLKQIKFLICADCDVGPLGWCEEGGKEFWLACSRVKYAVSRSG